MYCLSIVTTNKFASEMIVSTYYSEYDRECKDRMREIAQDAIERGEWEETNSGEWFMWLQDLIHKGNMCFMQVAPCYKIRH